jgi:two-component system, OmpR family, phosphate regulon sensor histidine kinase PhoR
VFRSLRWRIAIPYLGLILLVTLGLTLYLSERTREARSADLQDSLLSQARLVADGVAPLLSRAPAAALDPAAKRYAALLGARVTIISMDGTVLGESDQDPAQMDNHLLRPEVQQALGLGQGSSVRFSATLGYDMMYAAVAVVVNGDRAGIARVAVPLQQITDDANRLQEVLLVAGFFTALLAAGLALLGADRLARPVRQLTQVAERVAQGDLSARLLVSGEDDMAVLARSFNRMAAYLQDEVATLTEEESRLSTVLARMADGAVIVDDTGLVRLVNPAASRLLETSAESATGHSFAQAARDHRLIELWQRCQERGEEQTESLEADRHGRFLRAIVTPLQAAKPASYLVLLQDVTQVRRLETVRRDFVSNVSHELRTPLASLKALVDTLRDGALEDPPAARRFLDLIEAEVDAMTQMVQELLELARIESGRVPLHLARVPVAQVVEPAVDRLRTQADRAGVRLYVEVPSGLPLVSADTGRVQQVVTNLVHNAVKFTPAGGAVRVRAFGPCATLPATTPGDACPSSGGIVPAVVVAVTDTGVGIAADDLPRIFERFYKADKARGAGGTGLGLSIARHLIHAHGGCVWAESTEGRGSTFYFSLPCVNEQVTNT